MAVMAVAAVLTLTALQLCLLIHDRRRRRVVRRVESYLASGQYELAEQAIQAHRAPNPAEADRLEALLRLRQGRHGEAIVVLGRACRKAMDTGNHRHLAELGHLLIVTAERISPGYDVAIWRRPVLEALEDNASVHTVRLSAEVELACGRALHRSGELDQATALFQSALEYATHVAPSRARAEIRATAWAGLGEAAFDRQDLRGAVFAWRRALRFAGSDEMLSSKLTARLGAAIEASVVVADLPAQLASREEGTMDVRVGDTSADSPDQFTQLTRSNALPRRTDDVVGNDGAVHRP